MRKNRRVTGIYLIYCRANNKSYVGSAAWSIKQRFSRHINDLNKNKHCNKYLQRAWNKYGQEYFSFIVLEECKSQKCIELEQLYINSIKPEFNMCLIANSRLGVKHSPKVCDKISKAHKGKKHTLEHRENVSKALTGRKRPELINNKEWKRKLGRPVRCIDTNTVYYTAVEAAEAMGVTNHAILKAAKGINKTCAGYEWEYYEK
jgi:group I intron endonuclease